MKKLILLILISFAFSCTSKQKEAEVLVPKKNYSEFLKEVLAKRESFQQKIQGANKDQSTQIIEEARQYLIKAITEDIFTYWYGTPWDFNGTTRTPGNGKIACGYFVTNVLTDVGFDIPRVRWAQSASEVFIKQLANEEIKRFSNQPMSDVRKYLKKAGDGLYLVGLDSHVGFVWVDGTEMKFIHSNYYSPNHGVSSEELETHNPLNDSSYRVFGKLFSDFMVGVWIYNRPVYKTQHI